MRILVGKKDGRSETRKGERPDLAKYYERIVSDDEGDAPDVSRLFDGVIERSDNVLSLPLVSVLLVPSSEILSERLSSDGHDGSVDEPLLV